MATLDSLQQLKESLKSTWMAGDFGVIAQTIRKDAEHFVDRVTIPERAHVLDVACGTGNVAIPLARKGAIVTGIDIAPNLLIQARERAAAEALSIHFDEGDAEQLPYPDGTFDAVFSMFGAMFAPRPDLVVSELARVLKGGGVLAMANWNPASFTGDMFRVSSRYLPAPPGMQPPVLWGDDATVRNRLGPHFDEIRTELCPILFDMPTNAAGAVALFRTYFGPTLVAFKSLDESGQAAFASDLEVLWSRANRAVDPQNHLLVQNEYLFLTAVRRRG